MSKHLAFNELVIQVCENSLPVVLTLSPASHACHALDLSSQAAAVLAVKATFLSILIGRARAITNDNSTGRPKAWEEDKDTNALVKFLQRHVLLSGLKTTFPVERLIGCLNNASENEPFFLVSFHIKQLVYV